MLLNFAKDWLRTTYARKCALKSRYQAPQGKKEAKGSVLFQIPGSKLGSSSAFVLGQLLYDRYWREASCLSFACVLWSWRDLAKSTNQRSLHRSFLVWELQRASSRKCWTFWSYRLCLWFLRCTFACNLRAKLGPRSLTRHRWLDDTWGQSYSGGTQTGKQCIRSWGNKEQSVNRVILLTEICLDGYKV